MYMDEILMQLYAVYKFQEVFETTTTTAAIKLVLWCGSLIFEMIVCMYPCEQIKGIQTQAICTYAIYLYKENRNPNIGYHIYCAGTRIEVFDCFKTMRYHGDCFIKIVNRFC